MIEAVIFDMDGVLIDSEPENVKIIQAFYKAHGKVATPEYLSSLIGRSIHDTWDLTSAQWQDPISYDEYQAMYQVFRQAHPIDYPSVLFPDVIELLTWLKQEGYKIAIASSSKMQTINKVLEVCNLTSFFDLKMSGEMFKKSKPHPEIYLKSAEKLGLDVSQCIAIEDSKAGIASCNAAHMPVIAKIDMRYGANPDEATYKVNGLIEIKALLNKIKQS